MKEVVIIDSGGANLASLQYALERLGSAVRVSVDPLEIAQAPRVILPGVGSAADAMRRLHARRLTECVPLLRQPVLGICLGMQLFYRRSEEGPTDCLGILPDTVRHLTATAEQPVPHMGWNQLLDLADDPLLEGLRAGDYVYFVHSYAAPVSAATLARSRYGIEMTAVVRHQNFWGTQFHPERSARCGARLLANFLGLT